MNNGAMTQNSAVQNQPPPEVGKKQLYRVFTIVEKPGDQKDVWLNIGIAGTNRDGSIRCNLDCLPLNGNLQLRHFEPRKNNSVNNSSPNTWQQEGY